MLMNPAFDTNRMMAWFADYREELAHQVERLGTGALRTYDCSAGEPGIETTEMSLVEAKRKQIEADALWQDMVPREFQRQVEAKR